MKRSYFRIISLVTLGSLTLFTAGCESLILRPDKEPENVTGLWVTSEQLRVRARVAVNPLTGIVIEAADSIIAATDDPAVRKEALIWKVDAVPVLRESLFDPNPVVAFLDAWALSYQMIDYFEIGPGLLRMGDQAPVAQAACREIKRSIEEIVSGLSVDENRDDVTAILRNWAADHPITNRIAARESINNEVTEISSELGFSLGDVVKTMVTTVDDLNRKVEIYSRQLPSQARWEGELFTMEAIEELEMRETVAKLPDVMDAAIETMEVAQTTPDIVASERAIVLEAMRTEISIALETLRSERQAVMNQVTEERIAVMAEVEANRIALTEDLRAERKALEAMVAREREVVLDETEAFRGRLIDDLFRDMIVILVLIGLYLAVLIFAIFRYLNHRLWVRNRLDRPISTPSPQATNKP
jgi:hypothetical protein